MSNSQDDFDRILRDAGLPSFNAVADDYSARCLQQFSPLFHCGLPAAVVFGIAGAAVNRLTASLLLTMEVMFPGSDSAGTGLEAFIADLRDQVARGPKTMEQVEWLADEMSREKER